jgi:hypothetical protein
MNGGWPRIFAWIAIGACLIGLALTIVGFALSPQWKIARLPAFMNPTGILLLVTSQLIQPRRPRLARVLLGISLVLVVPSLIITVAKFGGH